MKKLAVIGANGLLGTALCLFFERHYKVIRITRKNYTYYRGKTFDIIINANGNSRRFWASKNAVEDFEASTLSVYKSLFDFNCGLYVFISTTDVMGQSIYGFHKHLAEMIIHKHEHKNSFLVLRCSALLGSSLKKGVVFDILNNNPLFVTKDSRLQFITVNAVADIIDKLIVKEVVNRILNVGGKGNTSIRFMERLLSTSAKISKDAETQIYNMNVSILEKLYPLKSSDNYLKEFIEEAGINERMEQPL